MPIAIGMAAPPTNHTSSPMLPSSTNWPRVAEIRNASVPIASHLYWSLSPPGFDAI